jgi:outer membrane receptor for ferrienterochelin and colicin
MTVRGVAALSNPNVPRYATADVRVGWQVAAGVEVSLTGRNLGDGGHGEFTDAATRAEIGRAIYAGVTWRFEPR